MNKLRDQLIKISLYLFFGYELIWNGIEQLYFINDGIFKVIFALIGIFLTYYSKLGNALSFRLIVFPIIGTSLYNTYVADVIKLHFAHVPHQIAIFWVFYVVFILVLRYYRRNVILFLISLWGLLVLFSNFPIQIFGGLRYWDSFTPSKQNSPIVAELNGAMKNSENIFLICLDGYPDFSKVKDPYPSILDAYLVKNGFQKKQALSIGDTPKSVPFLLSNLVSEESLYGLPGMQYNVHLESMMKATLGRNDIRIFSVFDDFWRRHKFFPIFHSAPMNYLLEKILLWFHWKNENAFSPNIINAYHEDLIHQIKSQKGILFLHFLSFHGLGYSTEPQLRKDVIYADYWLKKAIHKINQLNPNAHIIVFSDHGERKAKGFNRKDAILYVR